jgi:hypothetical protein
MDSPLLSSSCSSSCPSPLFLIQPSQDGCPVHFIISPFDIDKLLVRETQVVPTQHTLGREGLFSKLVPHLHHETHLQSPVWPNITVCLEGSFNIRCPLPSDFCPVLKELGGGRFFGVCGNEFTWQRFLWLLEDCKSKGTSIC